MLKMGSGFKPGAAAAGRHVRDDVFGYCWDVDLNPGWLLRTALRPCQAVVARMAHRDPAISGAATGAVRELLGSEAAAGGLARDAVGFQKPIERL